MDDLISRQAAIDAVSRGCQEFRGIFAECEKNLNALPAVQTCEDAVSRQAAIDALMKRDKELRNINWYDKPFAEGECKGIDYALEIVNALPSAQPTQSNAYNALKTLDCIDRQAAIEKLISNLTYMHTFGADRSIDLIEELPSVQPERKRGKWINSYKRQTCSVCKQRGYRSWSFCPNCGARMEAEG